MQDPPFTVKVEFSEGCNLACSFCGINSIREHAGSHFDFMEVSTAERIAKEVARAGWNPRIEFAMHGEPSMNPNRSELVHTFRKHLPHVQLMMTSNGAGFVKDPTNSIEEIFYAGLNLLVLDDYKNVLLVPKIKERYRGPIPMLSYPEQREYSPYKRYKHNTQVIILMKDISIQQPGVHNRLDNMGGCAAPKTDAQMGKRCAKPFRDLAFRWNGNVAICCDDWRGQYQIGSIHKEDIISLWNNDRFTAARRKLYHGERDFGACDGCSDVSVRVGLLPDKHGKEELPKPTDKDLREIQAGVTGKAWTKIVIRPWEKKA
jgi:organic radical activating enzyme